MPNRVSKSYTLEQHQIATIAQVAKDNGNSSDSAALRYILDDWIRRLAKENHVNNSLEENSEE